MLKTKTTDKTLGRLKKRPEFLFVAKGDYAARGCILIQQRKHETRETGVKVGFTCTKKVGNSVVRSRCKRVMREAARTHLAVLGLDGHDYVFIARHSLPGASHEQLQTDTQKALAKLTGARHNTANS